ncbi:hypothetical protein, partial [Brevundimonas sp.]|uniref:hypothetical protein n=1 Tax=Brevundimonas sp. TaxID=1871086 RepID=UPI00257A7F58
TAASDIGGDLRSGLFQRNRLKGDVEKVRSAEISPKSHETLVFPICKAGTGQSLSDGRPCIVDCAADAAAALGGHDS